MIKYKKTFTLILVLFLVGLFHEPLIKYSIFKFLKYKTQSTKMGLLEFGDIRFSNGKIVLQQVKCASHQDKIYHFEMDIPQLECILDFNILRAKFDLQLILHDPVIRLHKRGKGFLKSHLHHFLLQNFLFIKWKGYNVHYTLYDTTDSANPPSILEQTVRYVHVDHKNKDYKIEFSNFCNGGLFVSLSPIKDRYALDFRMINVDCTALKKLLHFSEFADVNNLELSGNLNGYLHLNTGTDGIYVYSGKLKCKDFVFCSNTLNTHLKAKTLLAALTTKNNRNIISNDFWHFLNIFAQKAKAKVLIKEGEFLLPIKKQKKALFTSVQGQWEIGYKHSEFNLQGIYSALDSNHPFQIKGTLTPKNLKQSRMACQFSFLEFSPILVTCGFDFLSPQKKEIDLDLISFKNSHLDLVFQFISQNYDLFSDYRLLSNCIGFNLKMNFLKNALNTIQINRFYGKDFKIYNPSKNLELYAKKLRSFFEFDIKKKQLLRGKFNADTFNGTLKNKTIFENLHAKMEIENSELKKLFCHSRSKDIELQLDIGGKNQIGTFSYKGLLEKFPVSKYIPFSPTLENNEILIQVSLSKLGPYLKLLGGIDLSNNEKETRIDFALELKNALLSGKWDFDCIQSAQFWGKRLSLENWKCPFQFKNTLITKGLFDIDGVYQKGFVHINLKCTDLFIDKQGFSLKVPLVKGAHFVYDIKTSQLIGSLRLKNAIFYPRYLAPIPLGSCNVHLFNHSIVIPQVDLKGFLGKKITKIHLNFNPKKHYLAHIISPDFEIIMNRDLTIQAKGQFSKKVYGFILSKKDSIEFDLNLYDTPLTGVLKRKSPLISVLEVNNFNAPIYLKNSHSNTNRLVAFDVFTQFITTSGVVPRLLTLNMHVQKDNQFWHLDGHVPKVGSFTGLLDFNELRCVIKNFLFHYSQVDSIPKRPSKHTFFVDLIKIEKGGFTIPFSKLKNETKDIAILYDISLNSFSLKDLTAKGTLLEKQMHFELFGKKTPLIRPKKNTVFYSFYDQKLHSLTFPSN